MKTFEDPVGLYESLEHVKFNDPTAYAILVQNGSLETLVVALANEKKLLQKQVCDLSLLVPRKIRMADGSIYIYRAPEHLIPDPAL